VPEITRFNETLAIAAGGVSGLRHERVIEIKHRAFMGLGREIGQKSG
jgi:hypothetical protein